MEIKCIYCYQNYGYTCKINNIKIEPDTKYEFIGVHENGRTNNDVKFIQFAYCKISKVPQGLTKKFPNLVGMQIWDSGLKNINRSDLFEYKHFRVLFFGSNDIKYLPGDLFADTMNLEKISFRKNLLTIVQPNILDGLTCLKYIDFEGRIIKYGKINSSSKLENLDPQLLLMKIKFYEKYTEQMRNECQVMKKLKNFIQSDELFKDFHIKIGEKQFSVHKILLVARSPTLAEILNNNPEAEYLNLVDISKDIFESVLNFLYTDEFPRETDFIQLFGAAERLKIDELKKYAEQKILEQLNHDNALEVLNLGNKYKCDVMKRNAFEEIKHKYSKMEFKEEWLNDEEKIDKLVEYFQKIQDIEKDFFNWVGNE